ncbi:MAG: metallophosphoesterase [Lentisphaeria bacterium]|nr:metallophosphoesterase [Lentisphaeria bacterium]
MQSGSLRYIFIADSHLSDPESTESFFSMLDCISSRLLKMEKGQRPALVFLGDIFELWIAISGYETESHCRFLSWCRKYKEEFPVYFIEGNHEFFVSSRHKGDFSRCTADFIRKDEFVFLHGDGVNLTDWKYRSLRILLRNPVTAFLLYLFSGTGGTFLAEKIRKGLKNTNLENKKYFPAAFMVKRACSLLKKDNGILVAGHFHDTHILHAVSSSRKIFTLPAWNQTAGLTGFLFSDGKLVIDSWYKLLNNNEK